MQSHTQANSDPNPVTTATTAQPLDTCAEPQQAQSEPDAQEKRTNSAAPKKAEREIPPQESETGSIFTAAETPVTVAVTQAVDNVTVVQPQREPSDTGGLEIDSASKPCTPTEPDINTNPGPDVQKAKKRDVRDGRKYVPSKKAMIDPLKMDMSKPLVMPLTCEYFTLQIFSSIIFLYLPR